MKLKLLGLLLLAFGVSHAQTISIVGTGVNGWPGEMVGPEIQLSTTDNVNYTISNLTISAGQVKFRKDLTWDVNWGGPSFPSGTGVQGGSNINTVAGTYTVNFNINTLAYSFVGASAYPSIGIWGLCVDAINGFGGPDVDMTTTDGVMYKLSAFNFNSGSGNFRQDNNPLLTFSSTDYPTGIAVAGGPNFFVPGANRTVYYNRTTGAYSFEFPSVGLLGTAIPVTGWDSDVNMSTTNGESYELNISLQPGVVKFRLDDEWNVNWGGTDFPSGTGNQGGMDIAVPEAANYHVTLNRATGAYLFEVLLGTDAFEATAASVWPNPSSQNWNIRSNGTIQSVAIVDLSGKLIGRFQSDATEMTIDGSEYPSGIYFAKITGQNGQQTLKLVKQ